MLKPLSTLKLPRFHLLNEQMCAEHFLGVKSSGDPK